MLCRENNLQPAKRVSENAFDFNGKKQRQRLGLASRLGFKTCLEYLKALCFEINFNHLIQILLLNVVSEVSIL